jgi:hypothetical protein
MNTSKEKQKMTLSKKLKKNILSLLQIIFLPLTIIEVMIEITKPESTKIRHYFHKKK